MWERLIKGEPLDGLGLGLREGRVDLSNSSAPPPRVEGVLQTAVADVTQLAVTRVVGVTWSSLDFSGSQLSGLKFSDAAIANCVFDDCCCRDWGLWGSGVSNSRFRGADLRGSALGGILNGRGNWFREVDFSRADMRRTAFTAADFDHCRFEDTRLDKVDFQGSRFSNCVFAGELREVIFYRKAFRGEGLPANEMDSVDFRRARLRWVEFRGLNLDNVYFPEDEDHIVVKNYRETLDRLLEAFAGRKDLGSRRLVAVLKNQRKWAGPKQRRGVLNREDLLEICRSEELVAQVVSLIPLQDRVG